MNLSVCRRLSRSTFHLDRHGHGFHAVRALNREVLLPPTALIDCPRGSHGPRRDPVHGPALRVCGWRIVVLLALGFAKASTRCDARASDGRAQRGDAPVGRANGYLCVLAVVGGGCLLPADPPKGTAWPFLALAHHWCRWVGGWECSAPIATVSPSRRRSRPLWVVCALGVLFALFTAR